MFKLTLKLTAMTLLVVGASMFLAGGKAAAANCPNAPGDNWGADNIGEAAGAMAGAIIHTTVGTYANADGSTASSEQPTGGAYGANYGDNLNRVGYTLHSSNTAEGNNRIFLWPTGVNGRYDHVDGSTGSNLFYLNANPPEFDSYSCDGYDAYGPATMVGGKKLYGNGLVLDCGAQGGTATRFWINNVRKPAGQDGYWELQTFGANGPKAGSTNSTGPNEGQLYFTVTNGTTATINLIWHAKKPKPEPPQGICTNLQVSNTGNYNSHSKRTHVQVTYVDVNQIKYNNDPVQSVGPYSNIDVNVPGDGGGGDSSTATDTRQWWYQPNENAISIVVTVEYYNGSAWEKVPGTTANPNPNTIRTTSQPCYSAVCSITSVTGDGPGGIVLAGGTAHVKGTYTNTSPYSLKLINPAIQDSDRITKSDGIHLVVPGTAENGYTYDFSYDMQRVPNTATNGVLDGGYFNFTPIYKRGGTANGIPPGGAIGGGCDKSFTVYQKFTDSGNNPLPELIPTDELPTSATYSTKVSLTSANGVTVCIPTTAVFYKQVGASKTTLASSSGPACAPGYSPGDTEWKGSSAIPRESVAAGNKYCVSLKLDYTSGYVGSGGPNDIVSPGPSYDQSSCDKITNKPYFKAYGSGVSAGVALKKADGSCDTAGGGLLAGWNNNSGGQERGAGSQLSALALIKITGFASAQTNFTRSPTDLTFANKGAGVPVSTSSESPELGGNFNGSGYCVNNVLPAATSTVGGPNYGGNGNVTGSQSVFVNGDVTITNNVKFGPTPAGHPENAPSFVLHATGNIKIAPNVTQLDGMYVSDQNIYTCDTTSTNRYDTCKNQLLVHGSFVADKVKLQRTFGSLRDEEPNPPAPGGSQLGLVWSCGGSVCVPPLTGLSCIHTYEPKDTNTWDDNQICLPSSSSVKLAWTYDAKSGGNKAVDKGKASLDYLKTHGYPYCTQWVPADSDGWDNNYLCSSQPGLNFSDSNDSAQYCTKIVEPSDNDGHWISGYFLCEPKAAGPSSPTPKGPPYTNCSNNEGVQATDRTCAAEVFELAPEMFLSQPATGSSDGCNSPTCRWDAVTSLPPVL